MWSRGQIHPHLYLSQQGSKLTYFIVLGQDSSRKKGRTIFKSLEIAARDQIQTFRAGLPDSPQPTDFSRTRLSWCSSHNRAFPSGLCLKGLAPLLSAKVLLGLPGSSRSPPSLLSLPPVPWPPFSLLLSPQTGLPGAGTLLLVLQPTC